MFRIRLWLHKHRLKEKSGYLSLLFALLAQSLMVFAPFLDLAEEDGQVIVLSGADSFVPNEAGDFRAVSYGWLCFFILFLILVVWELLSPKDDDIGVFWGLVVLSSLYVLGFGPLSLFYLISFALGGGSGGGSTHIEWGFAVFEALVFLPWVPFYLLRNRFFGLRASQPLFGTGLDDKEEFKKKK